MTYVVVYDIEDDRMRGRVAKVLEGYGRRVQESVFECRTDARGLEEMTTRLADELKRPVCGQVRVYRVCDDCLQASFGLGQIKAVDTDFCYIV